MRHLRPHRRTWQRFPRHLRHCFVFCFLFVLYSATHGSHKALLLLVLGWVCWTSLTFGTFPDTATTGLLIWIVPQHSCCGATTHFLPGAAQHQRAPPKFGLSNATRTATILPGSRRTVANVRLLVILLLPADGSAFTDQRWFGWLNNPFYSLVCASSCRTLAVNHMPRQRTSNKQLHPAPHSWPVV